MRQLVLLPGLDGTGDLFGPFLESLGPEFRTTVVAYPRDELLTYEQLESVVRSALPEREPFALVAESFSGPLAIRLAAAGVGQSLVLVASFAVPPVSSVLRFLRFAVRSGPFSFPAPEWLVSILLLGPHCPPALLAYARQVIRSVDARVLAHRVRQVLAVDVREELQRVSCPVLYLAPSRDRLLGDRPRRQVEAARPTTRFVSVAGPRMLLQRRARECAGAVRAFLVMPQ